MNVVEKLSEVSGIDKPVVDSIFQEVKENQFKLQHCSGPHDFSIALDRRTKKKIEPLTPVAAFGCYWECSKCGGRVESLHKIWYVRGLEDANK